jgi:hypothetical protein
MWVLIWSNQHGKWWRPNERGYTAHLSEAGKYGLNEAQRIVAKATCDGELTHDRVDPVSGMRYREVDEVIIPAPEVMADVEYLAREVGLQRQIGEHARAVERQYNRMRSELAEVRGQLTEALACLTEMGAHQQPSDHGGAS